MELELKITCTCHQAKITICCQTPLVAPIALKICRVEVSTWLNPDVQSDLLSDHSRNTSFNKLNSYRQLSSFKLFSCVDSITT